MQRQNQVQGDRFISQRSTGPDHDAPSLFSTKIELFPSNLERSPTKNENKTSSQDDTPAEANEDNKKMRLAML